jgi:hypothetical protein
MSKSAQRRPESQRKNKNIYETFKGSSVYPREEPSPAKPFFKFCTAEKGFVRKYETFRVSY